MQRFSSLLCFPRLYAAASLKRVLDCAQRDRVIGFPRLYAAASLKRCDVVVQGLPGARVVFRGFMPRPH